MHERRLRSGDGCTHAPVRPAPRPVRSTARRRSCTTEPASGGACQRTDVTGVQGARCVCERPPVGSCAAETFPQAPEGRPPRPARTLDARRNRRSQRPPRVSRRPERPGRALASSRQTGGLQPSAFRGCVAGLKDAYATLRDAPIEQSSAHDGVSKAPVGAPHPPKPCPTQAEDTFRKLAGPDEGRRPTRQSAPNDADDAVEDWSIGCEHSLFEHRPAPYSSSASTSTTV